MREEFLSRVLSGDTPNKSTEIVDVTYLAHYEPLTLNDGAIFEQSFGCSCSMHSKEAMATGACICA
jgi:hypothetical protein